MWKRDRVPIPGKKPAGRCDAGAAEAGGAAVTSDAGMTASPASAGDLEPTVGV
jgi:hypothetical protein